MIKAIETVYKGYKFRSRLEARLAVFFDTLDIEYQYEPEGFELSNGEWYLPDFFLPTFDLWIEIKGDWPTDEEKLKAKLLCEGTEKNVVIFAKDCWYSPVCARYIYEKESRTVIDESDWVYDPNSEDDRGYEWAYTGEGCYRQGWLVWGINYYGRPSLVTLVESCDVREATHSRMKKAYLAARQARFEHNGR